MQVVWLFVFLLASPLGLLALAEDVASSFEEDLVREKRFAPAIPFVLYGLRAAPALYRALRVAFGSSAVVAAGITLTQTRSERKRVSCCRGYRRQFHHVHNCLARSGGCCAEDKTNLPGLGDVGIVNPRKITRRDTSGNCGHCYSSYGKCNVR